MEAATTATAAMVWLRKGLRVHDNPALDAARRGAGRLYPVFVLDPRYLRPDPAAASPGSARAGLARVRFLLESLTDLDARLRRLGSRLLLLRARDDVADAVCAALKDVSIRPSPPLSMQNLTGFFSSAVGYILTIASQWNIGKLCFESDTEPYALARDKKVTDFAMASGIEVFTPVSHTLFDPAEIINKNGGRPPLTYQSFISIAEEPPEPVMEEYSELPPVGDTGEYELLPVPTVEELGYGDISQEEIPPFRGGETEALRRMKESLQNKEWVAKFEKPKGDPSAFLKPATTVLSPYLKFGCLSSRYFYHCIQDVYRSARNYTKPPVSLTGQLLWRDFFYTVSFGTPNFDQMKGNKICKQYHRIYSPITFGKKYDPNGNYIRHFIPVLKDMPREYIYEPWTAPLSIQKKAKCIIGKDYPKPVVDHETASKECRKRMGEAYASGRLDAIPSKGKPSNLSQRKMSHGDQDASNSSIAKLLKRSRAE
ncbi:(6-4)DNA photolyase [Dichanthelium oligosanthes]|uniref:(6-4)DNA photolyase n=1 Tax=Dichanthelium oligosanthes TaxID=888268 RepID=A0A1E5V603_9POAL|nr:(6-4)DNA photolyase [Dichanthelium oligosanthes]